MAKIEEQYVIIKMSKLVKEDQEVESFLDDETIANLETVVEQILDDSSIVVEVEKSVGE